MRASTGRYQSQLLNFLNQQSQRLKDQTGLMFRHLKLAAVTGAQIVLYPIYALFQATRFADRQLRQAAERALAYLLPRQAEPAADLAIQQILTTSTPLLNHLPAGLWPVGLNISAIASDWHTQQLCLVTEENQVIALPIAQQQSLQQRITAELAQYWYLWRRYQRQQSRLQLANPVTAIQTAPPHDLAITDRPHLAAPIRVFYQLMAWVQQGKVAHQLNFFSETAIVAPLQPEWFVPQLGRLPADGQIRRSAAAIDWDNFHWADIWATLPAVNGVPNLIRSAVAYFFGQRHSALPESAAAESAIADPWESPITVETTARPTETIVAEFVEPAEWVEPIGHTVAAAPTAPSLPVSNDRPALPSRALKQKMGGLVNHVIGRLRRSTDPAPPIPPIASLPAPTAANHGSALIWENVFSRKPTTTLIEAAAEHIGYVKHPLERVLEWLDRGLVWIESQLARLVQTLKAWLQTFDNH
jgi:hypothetical protein